MFWKRTPWRSDAYLAFVRAKQCIACAHPPPSEPHHWGPGGGTGLKCSDAFTVPLCTRCHRHWHDKRCFPTGTREEAERDMLDAQRQCLAEWAEHHETHSPEPDGSTLPVF